MGQAKALLQLKIKDRPYTNKDWLYEQYFVKKKSLKTIADDIGYGETVIHKWFHRLGLSIRTRHEALVGKKKSPEHVEKMRKRYEKWKAEGTFKGEKNPNWKNNSTIRNLRLRGFLRKFRKEVRLKFNNKCFQCGSSENLHAHHIKSWKDYPDLRYEISNGLLLCKVCHFNLHFGKTP